MKRVAIHCSWAVPLALFGVWYLMSPQTPTFTTACSSNLFWNETEAVLLIRCVESWDESSMFRKLKSVAEWNRSASSSYLPSRVRKYNIIFTIRNGAVKRTMSEEPGTALYLAADKNGLIYLQRRDNATHVPWRLANGQFSMIKEIAFPTSVTATPSYFETLKAHGWQSDNAFNPSSFKESSYKRRITLNGEAIDLAVAKHYDANKLSEVEYTITIADSLQRHKEVIDYTWQSADKEAE